MKIIALFITLLLAGCQAEVMTPEEMEAQLAYCKANGFTDIHYKTWADKPIQVSCPGPWGFN